MKVAIFLVHCVAPYQPVPSTLVTTRSRAEIGFDQSKGRYPAGSALPFRQTLLARLLACFVRSTFWLLFFYVVLFAFFH